MIGEPYFSVFCQALVRHRAAKLDLSDCLALLYRSPKAAQKHIGFKALSTCGSFACVSITRWPALAEYQKFGNLNVMSSEKITVRNINTPGRTETVRADKYNDMHDALLKALPETAPGGTFDEIVETVKTLLSPKLFPDGKTAGWWAKTVQLDLEAKGQIIRSNTKPLRFYKT